MQASQQVGPPTVEPDGLIPLMPFSKPAGLGMDLYTTPHAWESTIRLGPMELMTKLGNVLSSAMASHKADHPHIDFTWRYAEEEGGKVKRVKLRVVLYQTSEGVPWLLLQLRAGRSTG